MFRPYLRRRLSVALDTVAAGPDEPLLFLYPRWAAFDLRHRRPISSLTRATSPVKGCRIHFRAAVSSHVPSSYRSQSSQWISSSAVAQADNSKRDSVGLTMEDGDPTVHEEKKTQEGTVPGRVVQSHSVETPKQPSNPRIALPGVPTTAFQRRTRRRVLGSRGLLRTRPFPKRISNRDRKKLLYGKFVRATPAATASIRRLAGSWNDIRNLMARVQANPRAATKKVPKNKEILIPEETVGLLVGVADTSFRDNIYFSSIRNGCRVHILPPSEGDGAYRKAVLSGSDRARELVKDSIARARLSQTTGDPLIDLAKPPVPIFGSTLPTPQKNTPVPLIRGVWYIDRRKSLTLDEVLKYRSSINSVKAFLEHVDDLTRVQKKSSRKAPGPSIPCQQLVAKELLALFRQEGNRKFLSTAALNCALGYLSKRELLTTARNVFTLAEHVATVDTYNILLDAAARRQDKKMFRFLLLCMWRANIRPNSLTWVKLLKAMVLPGHKASLINHMARNGHLSDIGTIRSALQLTIEDTFFMHLQSGQRVESFVDLMAKTHGANWFSPTLLAQMFRVISRTRDYDALEKLLKVCTENNLEIESSSLTPIVTMFRGNVFNAIHHTIQFLNRPSFELSRHTYERLFLTAYKARRYNICRVLWRFACTEDKVTYNMRKAVQTSLRGNVTRDRDNDIGNIWRTGAGKIIVGIENQAQHPFPADIIQDLPAAFKHDPLRYLALGWQPQGPARDLQNRLASCTINRDIERGVKYKPQFSLGVMLEAASMIDREWAGKPRPLNWISQNVIKVPLKLKGI